MRTRGGKASKSPQPHGNRPRVRAKSKKAGIDKAYTALRARNLPLEAFTATAGEGEEERRGRARGEEERRGRADIEIRLAAPLLESTGRSPCRGAAPASSHLGSDGGSASPRTSGMKSACSSPCYRWPSARVVIARPHLPALSLRRRPSAPARLPSKCVCRLCSGPLNLPAPCRLLCSGPLNLPAPCRLLCSGPCTLL